MIVDLSIFYLLIQICALLLVMLKWFRKLNTVIQLRDVDLLLSYDTTFNLGEFYVSPLVFKHLIFEANPLAAGLFLFHERKLSKTHEHFFKILSSLVKQYERG